MSQISTARAATISGATERPTDARRASRPGGRPGWLWCDLYREVSIGGAIVLGIVAWMVFLGLWHAAEAMGWTNPALAPGPIAVGQALWELLTQDGLVSDIGVSVYRIVVSFALACGVAIPLGLAMGAVPAVAAALNPLVGPARYLPAPAFIPLLLMWFGVGDGQKLALLFLGVVFFLIMLGPVFDAGFRLVHRLGFPCLYGRD